MAFRWNSWETSLRNCAIRTAAHGQPADTGAFIRVEDDFFSDTARGVQQAYAAKDPLERERLLDMMRWEMLDGCEGTHSFDFDRLCIYKLKLMILEKWQRRSTAAGLEIFNALVERVHQGRLEQDV